MRTAVVLALVLIATSCTGDVERSSPSASFESNPSTPEPVPSPITALPFEGLRLGPRTPTDGWVVMADGFGVHVAGGGTLGNVDPRTGAEPLRADR